MLAGIPSSLAQAGPHPAFASLLAQQKPNPDPTIGIRPKDEELKRAIAETNGSKFTSSLDPIEKLDARHLCTRSHLVDPPKRQQQQQYLPSLFFV
jgi:hypothetical protein